MSSMSAAPVKVDITKPPANCVPNGSNHGLLETSTEQSNVSGSSSSQDKNHPVQQTREPCTILAGNDEGRDDFINDVFGSKQNQISPGDGTKDQGDTGGDGQIGTTSDYVLIAMIVAMMFCMTLCCLCLFCRSSSRLSICGINFELDNDRRNSVDQGSENLREIHEVVPLTPTTAGDYNNRIQDIESILRSDAPPPLYNEIVKKAEAAGQDQAKAAEAKSNSSLRSKKKTNTDRTSESSSVKSNGGRSSWRFSGRGLMASFRAKSSMLRSRRSDSSLQCPTVREGVALPSPGSDQALPPTIEESCERTRSHNREEVTVETVNEVIKENDTTETEQNNKVFVYDAKELPSPDDDDDVFL